MKQRFYHQCPHCLLIGATETADLYAHVDTVDLSNGRVELLARYSNLEADYVARRYCADDDRPMSNPDLREALALYSASL